ncbi:pseudouridine synthase family protein [Candidatus Nesciobacter abundans]|uniref:RNA pseudouridine synthase n=1 Tax=Candidatus Nesciobacter abundans TaxID=2601668 RepID=A0A5C0UIH8_9PROT|nr:RNA pseudouridine synthase [Candidatus Nesciobacter abundans]QEK39222.1 RNA pseudouridine synthase [Candidatus Nesciobacter abundans]
MKLRFLVTKDKITLRQWFREHFINMQFGDLQKNIRLKNIRLTNRKTTQDSILSREDSIEIWDQIVKKHRTGKDDLKTTANNTVIHQKTEHIINKPSQLKNTNLDKLIMFKSKDFCVIDKPYGICTQGQNPSIYSILKEALPEHPYIVHRLDKNTTGTLLVGLNREFANHCRENISSFTKKYITIIPTAYSDNQFSIRENTGHKIDVEIEPIHAKSGKSSKPNKHITPNLHTLSNLDINKYYLIKSDNSALLTKIKIVRKFTEKTYISKKNQQNDKGESNKNNKYTKDIKEIHIAIDSPSNRKNGFSKHLGKHFNAEFAVLEIELITGKKHQIRRHLSALGHPVLGDSKYGSKYNSKLALHCTEINFFSPQNNVEKSLESVSINETNLDKEKPLLFKSKIPNHIGVFLDKNYIKNFI